MRYQLYRFAPIGVAFVMATGGAFAQDQAAEPVAEPPALEPGPQPKVNHVVLTVQRAGVHLDEGQRVSIIGPINPNGDYLLIPLPVDESAETRWIPVPYLAWKNPTEEGNAGRSNAGTSSTEERPVYNILDVRVRDTREHQSATVHPAVSMQIVAAEEDGPRSVSIFTPPHEGSLGQHGGIAHLTSN